MVVDYAWYHGPADAQPAKMPKEDETWVGVNVPGQMTHGQRLRAAIQYADEAGYDSGVIFVPAKMLEHYVLLKAAVGHTLIASERPLGDTEFVFRDARRDGVLGEAMRASDV